MYFAELITGIILIIVGVLVKLFPDLIAGYNSLSDNDKSKIDIKKLSTTMRSVLVILGGVAILIGIISKQLNIKEYYSSMTSTTIIVITILILAFRANSYYNNK